MIKFSTVKDVVGGAKQVTMVTPIAENPSALTAKKMQMTRKVKMSDRINVDVLGTVIGTASGWDELEVNHLCFYDFELNPEYEYVLFNEAIPLKAESISINYSDGVVEFYEDNKVSYSGKLKLRLEN